MTILVTGAAGFVGASLVRELRLTWPQRTVVSFDALTYAGHRENLADLDADPGHHFVQGDVAERSQLARVFAEYPIDAVIHLAAESHVDRSIVDPLAFVRTNLFGTATLLEAAQTAWRGRTDARFIHLSTDEVFGPLDEPACAHADSPYRPTSPYAASKAGSDHLVRSWFHTYGFPALVVNSVNLYGPWQFPEKLIPVVIDRAMAGLPAPLYGDGRQVRCWLHVTDACRALCLALDAGIPGQSYLLDGTPRTNRALVETIHGHIRAHTAGEYPSADPPIVSVADRPGHDARYAVDGTHARAALGWAPQVSLEDGLRDTVRWYLEHADWTERVRDATARAFEAAWYDQRGGSSKASP